MSYRCTCNIVPKDVLDRLAGDTRLPENVRRRAAYSARLSDHVRQLRSETQRLTGLTLLAGANLATLAPKPALAMYDCKHTQSLPGVPVSGPGKSKDATVKRAFTETGLVAEFYAKVFGRNSIDNAGMTLVSSVHYGSNFNNAQWTGSQMLYGDGDGKLFNDFTRGNDVIGHELTHGVTQHTLQLDYANDAGGLNESLSDCFGSMFRQWQAKQKASAADWLIGKDIMGPTARSRGYTCLRNMANPADNAALAAQPTHYSQLHPGMDPHYTSGPPNLAFCLASKTVGGYSWDTIGKVWYTVMTTSGQQPSMTMPTFSSRTRQVAGHLFGAASGVAKAVDGAWKQVGL
jgi:Zn-dependent metalloprotease